jgi:hypothetical protein
MPTDLSNELESAKQRPTIEELERQIASVDEQLLSV